MKFRIAELLKCPNHPGLLPRIIKASLSEVFPYSSELRLPFCRSGCGLLGNWFEEISPDLPSANRLNCRRCLGTEIESGEVRCSEDDWNLEIENGILKYSAQTNQIPDEARISPKLGNAISRFLSLNSGDLILVAASIPEDIMDQAGCRNIERVQIEIQPEKLVSKRARSCTNGFGIAHYIAGPTDLRIFREEQFDGVIISTTSKRLVPESINPAQILGLLRPSGKAVLLFEQRINGDSSNELHKEFLSPDVLKAGNFKSFIEHSSAYDALFIEPIRESCANRNNHKGNNKKRVRNSQRGQTG